MSLIILREIIFLSINNRFLIEFDPVNMKFCAESESII